MAVDTELFRTLETPTTLVGAAPTKKFEGDTATGTVNMPVLTVKDSSGNLQYIQTDAFGNIPVNADPGTPKSASAEVASTVGSFVDVTTLALVVSKTYDDCSAIGSSSFLTSWRLVQKDDAVETIIARFMTGPGAYSFPMANMNLRVVTGGSGTQSLILRGRQQNGATNDIFGTVSAVER